MSQSHRNTAPVQMGSADHHAVESGDFIVTWARFPRGAVLGRHTHERATFAVIIDGGFDLRFPNPAMRRRELQCGTGTIFTEPAGEPHENHVFDSGAGVVVVQPDPSSELADSTGDLLDRVNHFRHGGLQCLARRLRREIMSPDSLSPIAIEALSLDMLVEAARLDPDDRAPYPAPGWLKRAEQMVHDRFRERLTLGEIAGEVGVHPAHLATQFRRRYGVPLATYMRRLRIEWAAARLAAGIEPISAIAYRAGFADQAHLTRVFKRETGVTPGHYRSRHGD